MKEKAVDYYINKGYSCSESVVRAAIDEGLCDESVLSMATAFSGGMGSGCLCGAVAGAQLVAGYNFGRGNVKGNPVDARAKAKEIVDEFKKRNKVTCCRVLSAGLEGMEKKHHCSKLVADAAEILEQMTKISV